MPPEFVFHMEGVSKVYDEKPVFEDINLSFFYGAKIGIVGENGAGKSTLLRIMAGEDSDIFGKVSMVKNMRVKLVAQEPVLDLEATVRDNLQAAMKPMQDMLDEYNAIGDKMAEPLEADEMDELLDKMGRLQEQIDACDGWELDRLIDIAADALVLPPDDTPVKILSGGERRRVALCAALLEKPDVLLLDEPTNHLDAETIAWLEQTLREYPGTVIVVTHDRYFLDNITKWILELDNGRGLPFKGNYSEWLAQKSEILRVQEKKESQRQRALKRELQWLGATPAGRMSKSKARVSDYEKLAGESFTVDQSDYRIQIAPGPRLGEKVLQCKGVCKGYQGVDLLKDCEFELPRGGVVGVVGPNGAGKTTLFRMIVGQETPDSGTLELGSTVSLSYVDQHRDDLDDNRTIFEEITGGRESVQLGDMEMNSRAYVSRFNFRGAQQQKKMGQLSGGERNRVHLAKLLKTGGNLILLDEPTNDLDVNTLRVLEQALIDFPGCAMVISHDRFFLDRICTHLLVFEGEGRTRWFDGNFQAYEQEVLLAGDRDRLLHRRGKYRRIALK